MIFVFGSNLAGVHGAGAARYAYKRRGAEWGVGDGQTGECYALPTKDHAIKTMDIRRISGHVERFLYHAKMNPDVHFQVTRVGCGLAGYKDEDIAPLFMNAPANCHFDDKWASILGAEHTYWGSF